jgi:hypothetical protein
MMSSLDRELESLQKPIPNGVDLCWAESGHTVTPSDTNNPWSQAPAIMSQWIFNRQCTKKLLPEQRAVGQTVIAHINSGLKGAELDSSLLSIFGKEVCGRYAGFINHIKLASEGQVPLPDGLDPTVGVNLATNVSANSDREALRKHAANLSASALQSYQTKDKVMSDGDVSLAASEMDVDIQSAGPKVASTDLTSGELDQITLAAKNLIAANDDIGLEAQQDMVAASMLSADDAQPLEHKSETEMLSAGSEDLDMAFSNGPVQLGDFSLDAENAIMGCDSDLESDIGGTPPESLLLPEIDLIQNDCSEMQEKPNDSELQIELDENKTDNLEMTLGDDNFEIEI